MVDDLDVAIIDALSRDGRRSLASIGEEVGLSVSAVNRRVDRLHTDGVNLGYTSATPR